MKKEAMKKNKLWLFVAVGVAALLAVAGIAAVIFCGNEEAPAVQAVADDGRPDLYWNLDRSLFPQDPDTMLSTREPAEDGMYHLRFVFDGEIVEYVTADKKLVNKIDRMNVMGLNLENGEILSIIEPMDIATEIERNLYVKAIQDDMLVTNVSIAMNGMTHRLKITELTEIYDVSDPTSANAGKPVDVSRIQVMDVVAAYANADGEITHIFLFNKPEESKIYVRVERMYDGNTRRTTRKPDENGVYSVEMFCDGEIVTLQTKDEAIVTQIDRKTRFICHYGFTFDEQGYIKTMQPSANGIRGLLGCEAFEVTSADSGIITAESITGVVSPMGTTFTTTWTPDCPVYDVSPAAMSEGRQGKAVESVQVGDRIIAWTDTEGKAVMIYILNRIVDVPVFYNPDRMYDSTAKTTTRTPNADGYYEVKLLQEGAAEYKVYRTKDKALITYLDSFGTKIAGVAVEGDKILRVYTAEAIFGFSPLITNRFVTSVDSVFLTVIPYGLTNESTGIMSSECKIYNFSGVGRLGEETTVQAGDLIYTHRQPTGEIIRVYVVRRATGVKNLYWNLERQYDSAKKETTRTPDADGYYQIKVANDGKQLTVKTKDKKLVDELDSYSPGAVGLILKDGVITDVYDPVNTAGAAKSADGYQVKSRSGNVLTVTNGTKDITLNLASDCVFLNCSDSYMTCKGEKISSLQKDDVITAFLDMNAQAKVIIVRGRDVADMYWNTDRRYDSAKKETTRTPDADGYYVFKLTTGGQIVTLKTKDKAVASLVDEQTVAFGLNVKDGIIYSVTAPASVKGVSKKGVTSWDITALSGNKGTIKYNIPGSKDYTGKTMDLSLAKDVQIYDVSPTATTFGAKATLQVGDRIVTYVDKDGNVLYAYITYHATRVKGTEGMCDHCNQVVHWEPWAGVGFSANGGHYYLNANIEKTAVSLVSLDNSDYEVILDLNGKTMTATGKRAFTVNHSDKLVILDSVGGGTVASTGENETNGGVISVMGGGKLTLLGGTLKLLESENKIRLGGVVYVTQEGSSFRMTGGKIVGGKVQNLSDDKTAAGGNIYVTAAEVAIEGGTIEGGWSESLGGSIGVFNGGSLTLKNTSVTGGSAKRYGGNIYTAGENCKLTIVNTTVSGGSALRGGNIFGYGTAVLDKAVITLGDAEQRGGNILINQGDWTFRNGTQITAGIAGNDEAGGYGGNIGIYTGTVTMNDTTLDGGHAYKGFGGNLWQYQDSQITMNDGTLLTNGKAGNHGGNIYMARGGEEGNYLKPVLNVRGTAKIADGIVETAANAGSANLFVGAGATVNFNGGLVKGDLLLRSGSAASVKGAPKILKGATDGMVIPAGVKLTLGDLVEGTEIYVNANGVFTKENANAKAYLDAAYFINTNPGMELVEDANTLICQLPPVLCPHCGEDMSKIDWKPFDAATTKANNGHYYLEGPVNRTTVQFNQTATDIVIDLRGQTFTTSAKRSFLVGSGKSLTILDTVGGGAVTGNETGNGGVYNVSGTLKLYGGRHFASVASSKGSVVYVENGGSLLVADTAIVDASSVTKGSGACGAIYSNGGAVEITGGEVKGGSVGSGGSIYMKAGDLTISGGTVSGGQAANYGDDIFADSTTTNIVISGGTVAGEFHVGSVNGITVSGKPVLNDLKLGSVKLTLGELTEGAQICVRVANGAFTNANENAKLYLESCYIKPFKADTEIVEKDNILYMKAVSNP